MGFEGSLKLLSAVFSCFYEQDKIGSLEELKILYSSGIVVRRSKIGQYIGSEDYELWSIISDQLNILYKFNNH